MRLLEYAQRYNTKKRGVSIENLETEALSKQLFKYATEMGAVSLGLKAGT